MSPGQVLSRFAYSSVARGAIACLGCADVQNRISATFASSGLEAQSRAAMVRLDARTEPKSAAHKQRPVRQSHLIRTSHDKKDHFMFHSVLTARRPCVCYFFSRLWLPLGKL